MNYDTMVRNLLAKPEPDYRFFPCVTSSWDKTARRPRNADVFLGSSPDKNGAWLGENAWNEWAEGCPLEPDQKYGRSHLEATARAWGLD